MKVHCTEVGMRFKLNIFTDNCSTDCFVSTSLERLDIRKIGILCINSSGLYFQLTTFMTKVVTPANAVMLFLSFFDVKSEIFGNGPGLNCNILRINYDL